MQVLIVVSLLFTYRDVALSASVRNEGTLPNATMRPFPFAQEDKPRYLRAEGHEVVPSLRKTEVLDFV